MEPLTIRKILEQVKSGTIRVPTFQRGFVWNPDRVAYLMDSIYKGYPVGSLLIWRTKERLTSDKNLGPYTLPIPDEDYPIDYILDGQQRITSIFGVFQTDLPKNLGADDSWTNIYFDFEAGDDAQESQFMFLNQNEVIPNRHFPLKCLFNTVAYRDATENLSINLKAEADKIQERFKEASIPAQKITTEDKTTVGVVFERVNQRGVELDTLQLLTAWTWSGDFHLQEQFNELSDDLDDFGFKKVGEDQNLVLRCASAVISESADMNSLIQLNGALVREKFPTVVNGIKGAIDFLRTDFHIASIDNLPYTNLLVPLSVFFSIDANRQVLMTDEQRIRIFHWFWRVCFHRRYNSQPIKSLQIDIREMVELKGGRVSKLGEFATSKMTPNLFINENFRINNVITQSFVLLLAQRNPRSFVSGSRISLSRVLKDYNRNEFHHLFPKSYIRISGGSPIDVNCLANFCFLSRSDNNHLGGLAPSIYQQRMSQNTGEIIGSALCPSSLFDDDFETFISDRANLLANQANILMGV